MTRLAAEAAAREAWRRMALEPPRAWGDPPICGVLRSEAADFLVEERLGFEADGGTAHVLVLVEKENANTLHVARELALRAGRAPAEVGFAGLKDRRAVARQWFSVPAAPGASGLAGWAGDGFRVLAVHPHSRKLRRGALTANRFTIRVRQVAGNVAAAEDRATRIAASGVPNYFGPQRFGARGSNLERVGDWVASGRLPRGREPRAFVLSAARSLAFNAVLGARVRDGSWNRLLPGEVVSLAGSHSVFLAESPDETLARRCDLGDIAPTGPLCGVAGMSPRGEALCVEQSALGFVAPIPDRLAAAGMRAERRPLVLRPGDFAHRAGADQLELAFELPPGAFATALLRELVDMGAAGPVAA